MAEDDIFRWFSNWIKGMEDRLDKLTFEEGEVDEEVEIAQATENLAFRDMMREDFVKSNIKDMAQNGTYKFFQKATGFHALNWDEEEYDVDDISDEIKDQFVGDDWKHILPFKWFGK